MIGLLSENTIFVIFLIAALGYGLGRIEIGGVSLGSAGILLVALVFGHFGLEIPGVVQNIGLVCFVTSVGFIAGPNFFRNFKGNARAYVLMGLGIILSGGLVAFLVISFTSLTPDLALGLLAGALTTTPGLAAGIEATGSDLVSVGYGIAYPFGVISVVLFVQLVPVIMKIDMDKERESLKALAPKEEMPIPENLIRFDSFGLFSFSVAIVLGLLIGKISLPLPGGAAFSLGTSGGPLLAGLIIGHQKNWGIFDMKVKNSTLTTMREFGLAMFLLGAGTHAGAGFVEVVKQRGIALFLYGALMALVPIFTGFVLAVKVFKLEILNTLGSICGGMTSTPALGTLIHTAKTDDVAASYAATYPVALAVIVIMVQLMGKVL